MKSLVILLVLAIGLSLTFSFIPSAYAANFSPVQPNAYASYNNVTNEVQVEWDFTTGGVDAPVTCLLKGDFYFYTDLNTTHDPTGVSGVDYDKVKGFIPIHYSVVSSSPTIVGTEKKTEVIPCQGNMRIDIDTVMIHPSNIDLNGNSHLDLQIFLSFYALDADTSVTLETFAYQSSTYMDQIFVAYTPNDTWRQEFQDYACLGEPGNVLYLDQSGIHGNNGDNCNQYLELNSNQWVDIGGANNAASLTAGETLFGDHDESTYPLLIKVQQQQSGGGGNEWKSRPTFGIGHEVPVQLVTDGFTYDDVSYDITDNWHTDFNSTEIKTGETHTFIQKGYFPKIMKVMGFNLGIAEIGKGYDSELQIDTFYDYQGNRTKLELNQDTNIIDPETLHVHNFKVACNETDTQKKCDAVSFTMTFLESLQYDIMAMQGTDQKNRSQWTYLNEGFPVIGKSLNPMKTDNVMGTEKYEGLIKVTQKEKYSKIWIAEDGREFEKNSYDTFTQINQTFEKSPSPYKSVMTRIHSNFPAILCNPNLTVLFFLCYFD